MDVLETMNTRPEFPNDLNGDVLRQMYEGGDDLTQARMIDFSFIFPDRPAALAFAEIVDDRDKEVCIHYYERRRMWQVTIKHYMVPDHGGITAIEATLSGKAKSIGGQADGWGCFRIPKNQG